MILYYNDLLEELKVSKDQFLAKNFLLLLFTNFKLSKRLIGLLKYKKLICFIQIISYKAFFL